MAKTFENVEHELTRHGDDKDTDQLLKMWCQAFDQGLMDTVKVHPKERNVLTGHGKVQRLLQNH